MIEDRICKSICQEILFKKCDFPGTAAPRASIEAAIGKIAMPNLSIGLVNAAIKNNKTTIAEMSEVEE